jgi:hypothetical protein
MADPNNDPLMRNQNAAVQARTKAQNRANVLQLKLVPRFVILSLTLRFSFSLILLLIINEIVSVAVVVVYL